MSAHLPCTSCQEGLHRHIRDRPGLAKLPQPLIPNQAGKALSSKAEIPALEAALCESTGHMLNLPAPGSIEIDTTPHLEGLAIHFGHAEHAGLRAQVLTVVARLAGVDDGFQTITDRFHDGFSLLGFSHSCECRSQEEIGG